MSEQQEQTLFRKKALDRISSPEQLTDYLRVTTAGTWIVFTVIVLFLVGLFAWASIGTLETKTPAKIIVDDHTATVISLSNDAISEGMEVRVVGSEFVIASVSQDEYGRSYGVAEMNTIPDGTYDGTVVVAVIHPIDFLIKSDS